MSTQSSDALLASVKNKLRNLQDSNKRTSGIWKPTGEHTVRLLPYKFSDFPFIELYFHYDLGKDNLLSPTSFGDPDPIVQYSDKIKAEGTRESYILSRKLMPTLRTYAAVIVRGEEDQGVRFWGFGKQTYEEILKTMDDPEYGNILDPYTGTDLKVSFMSAEEAGNKYGKITVKGARNSSKLAPNEETIQKWLNTQRPITDIYKVKTYDELMESLKAWLESKDDTEETSSRETAAAKSKPTAEEANTVSKATDAFKKYFPKTSA